MLRFVVCAALLTLLVITTACAPNPGPQAEAAARRQLENERFYQQATPEMQSILAEYEAMNPASVNTLSHLRARQQPTIFDAFNAKMRDRGITAEPPLAAIVNAVIPAPAPGRPVIPVRIYTPVGTGPFPGIVYFHGGGWVLADAEAYDRSARALANRVGALVISVNYRRAPEDKFPAAHEDAYAALQYVLQNASIYNVYPGRIAVAGESAGGNLATSACIMSAQRGQRLPMHQLLIYPITNYAFDTSSYNQNPDTLPLNAPAMRWYFSQYLNNEQDGKNILVSPLRTQQDVLKQLPPATIITAEIDPLHDEGEAYAQALRDAGVKVSYRNFEGVTHEFFGMSPLLERATEAQQFAAEQLREAFGTAAP